MQQHVTNVTKKFFHFQVFKFSAFNQLNPRKSRFSKLEMNFLINFLFDILHSNRNFCNFVDCNLQQNHNCQLMDEVRYCLSSLRIILYTFDLNKILNFFSRGGHQCHKFKSTDCSKWSPPCQSVQPVQTGPTHFTTSYHDSSLFTRIYHDLLWFTTMWEHSKNCYAFNNLEIYKSHDQGDGSKWLTAISN